ncbi:hypothetical protein [Actinoplanes palleronii]|uniref:Uncharacterized protein n=1 Tax=Actinoplanes palleronii TaxID=113570 RepID=A0ABQ4B6L9_9ACTN|nr:hypothetical protein [Actinoplanes palleronii]GIE66293.1 hypothetical protein Apa02nite_024010 [Actinoplanes palleronii]
MPDALTRRPLPDFLQTELDQLTAELERLGEEKVTLEERIGSLRDKVMFVQQLRERYLAERSTADVDVPVTAECVSIDAKTAAESNSDLLGSRSVGVQPSAKRTVRLPSTRPPYEDRVGKSGARDISSPDSDRPWADRVAALMINSGDRVWSIEQLNIKLIDVRWSAEVQRRAKTALRKAVERMLSRGQVVRTGTAEYRPTALIANASR